MSVFCNNCGRENKDTAKFCSGCGAGFQQYSSGSLIPDGTVLVMRYKINTHIKTGGMGAVYKAEDIKFNNNICAVKELLPPYGTMEQVKKATEWFKREAQLLNKLDHTNLPKVTDYFVSNGRYYLVMNYIDGEDLEKIIKRDGNPGLSDKHVLDWINQILDVLDYLHSQNPPVVYRDLKPGNIMIRNDGRAMLIDFGIARVVYGVFRSKQGKCCLVKFYYIGVLCHFSLKIYSIFRNLRSNLLFYYEKIKKYLFWVKSLKGIKYSIEKLQYLG